MAVFTGDLIKSAKKSTILRRHSENLVHWGICLLPQGACIWDLSPCDTFFINRIVRQFLGVSRVYNKGRTLYYVFYKEIQISRRIVGGLYRVWKRAREKVLTVTLKRVGCQIWSPMDVEKAHVLKHWLHISHAHSNLFHFKSKYGCRPPPPTLPRSIARTLCKF